MARFSLVPKNSAFDTLLGNAGSIAAQTARTLHSMLSNYPDSREMLAEIKQLENQGDRVIRELVRELHSSFITEIDREDIYELASALDDVIDYIDEAALMLDIYQVESVTSTVIEQAAVLVAATEELVQALGDITTPERMERHWERIHELEDRGDQLLRDGIREVFSACYDEPAVIICWKDIYTQLEEAIDSAERAATILESIAVKHN